MIIWLTPICIFLTGLRSSPLMMLLFHAIKDRKAGGEWDLGASWCTRGDHIVKEDQAGLFLLKHVSFKVLFNIAHFSMLKTIILFL